MSSARKREASAMADWVSEREFPSRERRVHVNMPANVQVSSERTVLARIVDLSANGFRLVSEELLQPGQRVEVASRKDASEGRICWVNGNEAGGIFIDGPRIVGWQHRYRDDRTS